MRVFTNGFTRPVSSKSGSLITGNIKSTLTNIGMSAIRQSVTGSNVTLTDIGEPLVFLKNSDNVALTTLRALNIADNLSLNESFVNPKRNLLQRNVAHYGQRSNTQFFDPFKFDSTAIGSLNNYNHILKSPVTTVLWHYTETDGGGDKTTYTTIANAAVPSLFNPNAAVAVNGIIENTPLRVGSYSFINDNTIGQITKDTGEAITISTEDFSQSFENSDDCSIDHLIKLSQPNPNCKNTFSGAPLGWATFRYADFMYCRDVGKIANNHLIVLRKFSTPVGDNIIKKVFDIKSENTGKCVGKLLTWFGTEENKLEDICKFNFNAGYKDQDIKWDEQQSTEDQPNIGSSIVNLMSMTNAKNFKSGIDGTNENNSILNYAFGKIKIGKHEILSTKSNAKNASIMGHYWDHNKVFHPENTIQDAMMYTGVLKFNHSFSITFNYKLRAYDNINPRSAFMDLIGNILMTTYKRGTFWGGGRTLIGQQQNHSGWKMLNQVVEGAWKTGTGTIFDLLNQSSTKDVKNKLGDIAKNIWDSATAAAETAVQNAQTLITEFKKGNLGTVLQQNKFMQGIGSIIKGGIQNKLGRPQIYQWQTLATGAPQGFWHVTVGNPLKPILTMGNLVLEDTEVTHMGPLGIDDFPTEIKVVCKLKHARSRDATEISKMYTGGSYPIYLPLSHTPDKFYEAFKTDDAKFAGLIGT